jgi:type IV pilus assembly protein PilM
MSNSVYFYKDRPLFGLDIGVSGVKALQLDKTHPNYKVQGYGFAGFDESFFNQGIIQNYEGVASAIHSMFQESIVGSIDTNRVAISVPAAFTFSRIITLPQSIDQKDVPEAVLTEIQQYLPSALNEMYTDYTVVGNNKTERRVLTVAAPQKIIDSYMALASILGLEVVAMEPTISASNRLFGFTDKHKVPSVLIDFGALSTDITVYDDNLVVTGTVSGGGEHFTNAIQKALGVTDSEAHTIKTRFGLNRSKKQTEITMAVQPFIEELVKEIRRMVRYYEERVNDKKKQIGQVVTLGGGANIPGLSEHLTNSLRLPVRSYDPWSTISFGKLKLLTAENDGMFVTAAGLALLDPKEPFA